MASPSLAKDRDTAYPRLIELGIALSAEHNHNRLLEKILLGAKEMSNSDGGTLYLVGEGGRDLRFMIMRNDSMGMALGGTTGAPIPFPPVPLRDPDGSPNYKSVVAAAAVTGETINLADAYNAPGFDFSGTRAFDARTGYRSQSFLTLPLKNHEAEVVGVLQLINARSPEGQTIAFPAKIVPLIEALASQAAVALDNQMLIDAQRNLFRAFLKTFASAIDAKSVYTGGHCHRVPELTNMLARAADAAEEGPLADFHLSEVEWYELEVAGGLHDCGKVTTREFVVDKATKLETLYNRIHEIRTRFEVVKRDAEIEYLRAVIAGGDEPTLRIARDARVAELDDDFAFVAECNIGSEFMDPGKIARLQRIGGVTWLRTLDDRLGLSWEESARQPQTRESLPATEHLLADKPSHVIEHDTAPLAPDNPWGFIVKPPPHKANLGEVYNLSIRRGTLTEEERYHINDHIVQTIIMLETLPYPKQLRRVPEWAGGHHREDGRYRLSARAQARTDEHSRADHDDRRYLRGTERPRPALQGAQKAVGVHRHHGAHEPRASHRPRPVRTLPDLGGVPAIRRPISAARADRRGRYRALSRIAQPAQACCRLM